MRCFRKKLFVTTVGFFVLWVSQTTLQASDQITRVFIFAGQSNMTGSDADASEVNNHPPYVGAATSQKDVLYAYNVGPDQKSNGWVAMGPIGRLFGPEMTFARRLKKHIDDPIVIIKDSWGGTTLIHDWDPKGPAKGRKLYARLMKQISDRLRELDAKGITHRIEAMMWHQGENDMFDREGIESYEKNLRNFIACIRNDLKVPKLPFFVGEISNRGIWGMDNRHRVAKIYVQQMAVAKSDPNVHFVPTSHLAFKVGRPLGLHYHFGTLGQLQHGEEYVKHYLAMKGSPIEQKDRSFAKSSLPKGKTVKLYVLGGQRNMEGERAYVSQIASYPKFQNLAKDQTDVLYQYSLGGGIRESKNWEPLGLTGFLNNFGPELSFGNSLKKSLTKDQTLAIYKFTHGGAQSIDWIPEGTDIPHRDLYQKLLKGIQKAKSSLEQQGYTVKLAGVVWHCGENDRSLHQQSRMYARNLKKLIDGLRRDLSAPKLHWWITEQPVIDEPWSKNRSFLDVSKDVQALADSDEHIEFLRTAHLPHEVMLFGTEGILELGDAMARAVKE